MDYTIENEYLRLTVTTAGAQVKSVVRKCDGVEHMWQADKSVWGYHAPVLFPHAGKVPDGKFTAKGQTFASPQHGFARIMEHTLVEASTDRIVLELADSPETLAYFPYRFSLLSVFTLEEDTVCHTLEVQNWDETPMPFGIGYHPAFRIPFDDRHTYRDYELRFSETESPLCVGCLPLGLVHGDCYRLGHNIRTIAIDENLFRNDSHCMVNLKSQTLGIYEKDTGRAVVCDIADFPYTLIWSKPGAPRFLCIEPWHSLPSAEGDSDSWEEKPAAAILAPGENWATTLRTRFAR